MSGDIWPPREGFDFGVPCNMKHERHRPDEVMCVSTFAEMGIDRIWVSDNRFIRPSTVPPYLLRGLGTEALDCTGTRNLWDVDGYGEVP